MLPQSSGTLRQSYQVSVPIDLCGFYGGAIDRWAVPWSDTEDVRRPIAR